MGDKRAEARELYESGLSLTGIAEKLGVKPATVRSWKLRDAWPASATLQEHKKNVALQRAEKKAEAAIKANEKLTEPQRLFCLYYIKSFNALQSYLKAYNSTYKDAVAHSYLMLRKPQIRTELERLRKEREKAILAHGDDVVERYLQIAFSSMSDYAEWGRTTVEIMGPFGPIKGPDGEVLTREVNDVRFADSSEVDGSLVSEVKVGKSGASIKLHDQMKALEWLSSYFELNPADVHRREYERRKLELEAFKAGQKIGAPEQAAPDDGFIAALNAQAADIWADGDDKAGDDA